jgi:hypothetical protein
MSTPPRDGEVEDTLATIVGCFSRYNNAMTEKSGAMSRNVGFIETLDCLLVSKLLEGPEWTHEILCGIALYVALHTLTPFLVGYDAFWRNITDRLHNT